MDAHRKVTIRRAAAGDLPAIAAIQAGSPEAAHWDPADYLNHDCRVAAIGSTIRSTHGRVAGFLVTRQVGPGEREILNLAVEPSERRTGLARRLLGEALASENCTWFLEVRASNAAAIHLYESAGFERVGRRPDYYHDPAEDGIVMRLFS